MSPATAETDAADMVPKALKRLGDGEDPGVVLRDSILEAWQRGHETRPQTWEDEDTPVVAVEPDDSEITQRTRRMR